MKKTYILLFMALCGLCACDGRQKEGEGIRIAVLKGPTVIALAGWLEQPPVINGKTVSVEIADSPEQIQAILIKGDADIAALPMINAANLYNKGVRYTLAGCPVWGNLYLVGKKDARRMHLFGSGTTPDILTRYYMDACHQSYSLDYTLRTVSEVAQALLLGKAEAAVLGEPFVDAVLRKDTAFHILADLNNPDGSSPGFAETAIVLKPEWENERRTLDSLLQIVCRLPGEDPGKVIRILEERNIFPPGMLTPRSIERCKIRYVPVHQAKKDIETFLHIIRRYEPKAIGGKLPGEGFYESIPLR
jgi:NitT/TauT family transport system substrate-binding protein